MTAINRIAAVATEHGWRITTPENDWERYLYERRNGREVAQVAVVYDVRGAVHSASRCRNRRGDDARVIHSSDRGKERRVAEWLTASTAHWNPTSTGDLRCTEFSAPKTA